MHWYGHVLRREDCHIVRRAFEFKIDIKTRKWRPKRRWKQQVREEDVRSGLSREDAFCRSNWIAGVNHITIR